LNFEGIELPSLKFLDIRYCGSLTSLHGFRRLEYLKMEGCHELYKIYGPNVGKDSSKISQIIKTCYHPINGVHGYQNQNLKVLIFSCL
jgi:hypothetical protein